MTRALSSSELALVTAERDEYREQWQEALRLELATHRLLREAEDARDNMQARVEAALELLDGRKSWLAVHLLAILNPSGRSA